jgi:hypothetical protein
VAVHAAFRFRALRTFRVLTLSSLGSVNRAPQATANAYRSVRRRWQHRHPSAAGIRAKGRASCRSRRSRVLRVRYVMDRMCRRGRGSANQTLRAASASVFPQPHRHRRHRSPRQRLSATLFRVVVNASFHRPVHRGAARCLTCWVRARSCRAVARVCRRQRKQRCTVLHIIEGTCSAVFPTAPCTELCAGACGRRALAAPTLLYALWGAPNLLRSVPLTKGCN